MSQSQYIFSSTRNSYFNGLDLRVEDKESHEVVTLNVKEGFLAVEVKDDDIRDRWPADVKAAADVIGDDWLNNLYESAQTAYWEASQTAASEAGLGQVFGAGHSGGWMAVEGAKLYSLEDIIEPPNDEPEATDFADRFLHFAFERIADIEWHRGQFFEAVVEAAKDQRGTGGTELAEPIKVLAVVWVDDDGQPNCNLYRNKPALLGAMGTFYEGAATNALQYPGEPQLADSGESVAFLTVVE